MNFIPNALRISFKSWSVWAAAAASVFALAGASMHAFDAAVPTALPTIGGQIEGFFLACSAFCGLVLAPILRGIQQNFGTDAAGNQIVTTTGTAPPGTTPNPPIATVSEIPGVKTLNPKP